MQPIDKVLKVFTILIIVFVVGGLGYSGYRSIDQRLSVLNREVNDLSTEYASLLGELSGTGGPELVSLSQEDALTSAVSEVAPSVVSIAVTKDVPRLEVIYINPFGDDPYNDPGIRIPRFQQQGTREERVAAGSGFIVSPEGYIVTNRHLIQDDDSRYTVLLSSGDQLPGEVIYVDTALDIAILKIAGDAYQPITLGSSAELKIGQTVFAVGNALGEYSNSVSVGIVSGLNRDLSAYGGRVPEKLSGVIQTDAAINPGNSGGPLVNLDGEVVGVNVAMATAENIGFAIPIDDVREVINQELR